MQLEQVGGAVMIGVIVGTGGTAAITGAPFVSAGAVTLGAAGGGAIIGTYYQVFKMSN